MQILRGRGVRWIVALIMAGALAAMMAAVVWAGGTSASKSISDQSFGFVTTSYGIGLYVRGARRDHRRPAGGIGLEVLRQRAVGAGGGSPAGIAPVA